MHSAVESIGRMQPYGTAHLLVLAATVLAAAVLIWWARRDRVTQTGHAAQALRIAGWVTLAVTVLWTLWGFLPGNWNINESLPFHFSDAARLVTAIALITRAGWAIVICYFWGLTLNMQSMLTPDLNYFHVPALEFAVYWFLHVVVLLVPTVFVWGFGYRPTWRGYGIAYAATVAWAGVAIVVNAITGANYAYLSRAPVGPSILDVLGPWPLYIIWEAVLVAVVWALMTWPWEGRCGRRLPHIDGVRTSRRRAS